MEEALPRSHQPKLVHLCEEHKKELEKSSDWHGAVPGAEQRAEEAGTEPGRNTPTVGNPKASS